MCRCGPAFAVRRTSSACRRCCCASAAWFLGGVQPGLARIQPPARAAHQLRCRPADCPVNHGHGQSRGELLVCPVNGGAAGCSGLSIAARPPPCLAVVSNGDLLLPGPARVPASPPAASRRACPPAKAASLTSGLPGRTCCLRVVMSLVPLQYAAQPSSLSCFRVSRCLTVRSSFMVTFALYNSLRSVLLEMSRRLLLPLTNLTRTGRGRPLPLLSRLVSLSFFPNLWTLAMSSLFHRLSGSCWLRSVTMVDAQSSLLSLPSFSGTPKKTILACRFVICCCSISSSIFFSRPSEPFCSAFHFLYVLFFLLQPFCQDTYLDRHWIDSSPKRLLVEIVSSLIPSVRPSSLINSSVEGPGFDSTSPQSLRKREEGGPSYNGGDPCRLSSSLS